MFSVLLSIVYEGGVDFSRAFTVIEKYKKNSSFFFIILLND